MLYNEIKLGKPNKITGGEDVKYNKLCGRIKEVFGTQKAFALAMEMNGSTLSLKLGGKAEWIRSEIVKACELLAIPLEEAHLYFFCR